jgi:site-specific DNA-methyltransferase (adenine-specific)
MDTNVLYYGDNLEILRKYIPDESIDLIYLDPPFNSKATYNVLFKEPTGKPSQAQISAFEDTWHWGLEAERALQEIAASPIAPAEVKEFMSVLPKLVGKRTDMAAYLTMMCIRLIELRRVLKDTGSLYLHCDPTASHYLKLLMDTIFGAKNFRNEIVWCYRAGGVPRKGYPSKHDTLFFYMKSKDFTFNPEYVPYTEGTLQRGLTKVKGKYFEKGLRAEGTPIQDWWSDIQKVLSPTAKEMLGYPTQKPLSLLERIIRISSNEGDIVLDPFCGCGTALVAAQKLNRKWIGIDITHLAIGLMEWRLRNMTPMPVYKVIGEPKDLASALELANKDKYQFQWWAVKKVGGQPYGDKKKGADTGIDGYLYYMDEKDKIKKAIISVKGGGTSVKDIRDLGHVIDREKSDIGVFISLEKPTRPMIEEAAMKGFYHSPLGKDYPRIQIITIEEIFQGKSPDIPPWIAPIAKPAPSKKVKGETKRLL